MSAPNLRKMQTADRAVSALQEWADSLLRWVGARSHLDATAIENVDLSTGENPIDHKLGRELRGWIITRMDAGATIYDAQGSNAIPGKTLLLVASAPVRVSLLVW